MTRETRNTLRRKIREAFTASLRGWYLANPARLVDEDTAQSAAKSTAALLTVVLNLIDDYHRQCDAYLAEHP